MAKELNHDVMEKLRSYTYQDYLSPEDAQLYNKTQAVREKISILPGPVGEVMAHDEYERIAAEALQKPDGERIRVNTQFAERNTYIIQNLWDTADRAFSERFKSYPAETLAVLKEAAAAEIESQRRMVNTVMRDAQLAAFTEAHPGSGMPEEDMLRDLDAYNNIDSTFWRAMINAIFSDTSLYNIITVKQSHLTETLKAAGRDWETRMNAVIDDLTAQKWEITAEGPAACFLQPRYGAHLPSSPGFMSNHPAAAFIFEMGPNHAALLKTGIAEFIAAKVTKRGTETIRRDVFINQVRIDLANADTEELERLIFPELRPTYDAIEQLATAWAAENNVPYEQWGHLPAQLEIPLGRILRKESGSKTRTMRAADAKRLCTNIAALTTLLCSIYCPEEAAAHGFLWQSQFEPALSGTINMHGDEEGTHITLILHTIPILARYAYISKKYLVIDPRYYMAGPSRSARTKALQGYLMRRIMDGYIRREKKVSLKIESIAAALGVTGTSAIRVLRSSTSKLLNTWAQPDAENASRLQFIKSCRETKIGRKITGFAVNLLDRKADAFKSGTPGRKKSVNKNP